ncbi:uncharacterized ATP-dependent helicase C29A10.10c-like [Argentina anserina]|uniref:uncharacterized ATP-dependent helicase C29A10.10c-like n=1 Tax=Argentina anserina TaxID=57926 RepID=UPI002176951B|nr:uncharacterized ATP-dependent helicase C29A10.10c-like [Potentilla anserina]XP_050364091.1 uncharacterized ATP-dependent helicase C29A10.10c-like [Potentilla anserina]
MERESSKVRKKVPGRRLIDEVFSWSIRDVLNKDHYKNQVTKIPETFSDVMSYMRVFVPSLLEETHEDLRSSVMSLSQSPACEILTVETSKDHKPPKDLFYQITCKRREGGDSVGAYEPEAGDIIALTDVRPKHIDDLNRSRNSYLIAFVIGPPPGSSDMLLILASKSIEGGVPGNKRVMRKSNKLFAVYLMNMTTNVRVWKALNSEPGANTNLLRSVLQVQLRNSSHGQNSCTICCSKENSFLALSPMWPEMCSDLNDSQEAAVLNCISLSKCHHQNSVQLIWGPPGTGKTKTVGLSLFALFQLKCKTLTCTPTNISIVEVTKRLVKLVNQSSENDKYGLGDIILFGNRKRLKIDSNDDLLEVVKEIQYSLYLKERREKYNGDSRNSTSDYHNGLLTFEEFVKEKQYSLPLKKGSERCVNNGEDSDRKNSSSVDSIDVLTFEEFLKKNHTVIGENLTLCMVNLYTHLPTSCISLNVVKYMIRAIELLKKVNSLVFKGVGIASESFQSVANDCVVILRSLRAFCVPNSNDSQAIRKLCLENVCLIFCTASTSARLHAEVIKPLEILVIDEAARLKECESAIPLQLGGLRHAILIGDERQLSAMVKSKIAESAGFGRSLFERLVLLGHEKHLLNVQYRMHPSISLFPKREFYNNQILDGPNVNEERYEKCFLEGKLFGPYSFINIADGKEEFGRGYGPKNMVEVAVVDQIVLSLYKEFSRTKKKISIGIISPYNSQVYEIEQRVKKYNTDQLERTDFSVSVRSVDGFQGGEEDVIINSTVRCNGNGSIGFLSNLQRVNVVLTRARHCLWILGNGPTLCNSNSIWKKLIIDAKNRNCFFNAEEDTNLSHAMVSALVDLNQVQALFNSDSLLFRNAKWKVYFANEFKNSIAQFKDPEICHEVASLLKKLSNGWRQSHEAKVYGGTCCQLLEKYQVHLNLNLIWSVDILQDNSQQVQIIQVWDIVQHFKVPELAKRLNIILGCYTMDKVNRCKQISLEGDSVVPITWPLEYSSSCRESDPITSPLESSSSCSESDPLEFLSTPLSCITLGDEPAVNSNATYNSYCCSM